MRSVITVLAAAVMGAASAFGTSASAVAGVSAHRTAEVDAMMSADFAVGVTASVPGAALRPAPPASGTIDLSGQYLLTGMSGGQSAVARSFEIVQEGNEVTLKKFIFPDANDIHGTVATRNLNGTIYDVIQIEPGQVLFTQDEQEFKLYLFGPYSASQPGNFVYDKDPVVLAVTEEGLVNYYDMSVKAGGGVGYFYVQPDGQLYGGMVLDVKAVKCNSRYSLVETDAEDIQVYVKGGQVVERDTTDPNVFHVTGFAGYGNASFTVNPAKRTVVSAPNQCEVVLKMQDGSTVPFYATCNIWVEGEPIPEYVIRGNVEPVDDDSAVVYLQNWFIADWNYGFYVAFMETEMTLPFNPLKTDGVESVSVDSADDAPAEYYSLQGVRVMNPEAGQLVIKRQGSEVRKLVIR